MPGQRPGLVAAQAEVSSAARRREADRFRRERAVLVAVEFTGERRKLTAAVRQARRAAEVSAGANHESSVAPSHEADLDFEASLAEFEELARSAGAEVAATLVQRRARPDAATLVGQGKLDEIEGVAASTDADLVLFDHDLTPSQLRNLEARLPCRVIDRTQLILDIFARHARTREGQLQVELAQLQYQLPRLAGRGKAMSQLGGGIGTRGPGETQLETDRRKINLRIDHVKGQLESVRRVRRQQRQRREAVPVPVVTLVGYTNAGKSTLFNALTRAGVFVENRLFATLDSTTRQLVSPEREVALLTDTVGFIRKLPHHLVASFHSTLAEAIEADVLIHVTDASDPDFRRHLVAVDTVLDEILTEPRPPRLMVFNKADQLDEDAAATLRVEFPDGLLVSALDGEGLPALRAEIFRRAGEHTRARKHPGAPAEPPAGSPA